MPYKATGDCRVYGCGKPAVKGGLCREHYKLDAAEYNKYRRDSETNARYNGAWRRISKKYKDMHPMCERCLEEGFYTPVEEVHHIIPLTEGGTNKDDNLISLCKKHHIEIHGNRRRVE